MEDSDISTYGSSSRYGGSFIDDDDEDNQGFNEPRVNDDKQVDDRVVGESSAQGNKSKSRILALSEEEEFQIDDETKKMLSDFEVEKSGVIVEELRRGPTNGKIATLGKNVKIYYTGMLKETGQVFHINAGKSAFNFVLGENDFIDGMSAGIEGMRVGDKRRLTFPAPSSSGYGDVNVENIVWCSYGDVNVENIVPQDSLIVYEVELVAV